LVEDDAVIVPPNENALERKEGRANICNGRFAGGPRRAVDRQILDGDVRGSAGVDRVIDLDRVRSAGVLDERAESEGAVLPRALVCDLVLEDQRRRPLQYRTG
jgi:hypothetical protein